MAASAHADSQLPPLINALNASVKDSCSQMVHSGDAGSPAKSLSQDLVTGEIADSHKSVDMDQLVLECSTFPCQKDGMVFSESSAKSEEIFEASKVSKDSPHIATNAVGADITLAFQNMSIECGVSNAKVSRPPWRIPPVITEEGIKAQPVMGATVWPALTEARNMKPSDIRKSKAKTASSQIPPAPLEVHHECLPDGSHKQQGEKYRPPFRGGQAGMGRPPFQVIENGTSSVQPPALGLDRVSHFTKHNLHMQLKNNSPLKQVTDSDQFHGNDGGKFFNNSRKWKNGQRDHGKNNSGYQQQQKLYENGSGNVTFLQEQHVGPRNMPRPPQRFLTVLPPVFPFPAFPHTGMHYVPPGTTIPLDFLHGTPYIPLMLPVGGMIHGMDPIAVRSMLVKQLDYYFSVENLCKDVYLRKHMDAEGFVPVSLIAQFNKVRNITQSLMVILDAALHSTVVEVQHDKIRRRHDGGRWQLLPGQTHPINVVNENISVRNLSEGGHRKHEQAQMVGLVSSSTEANSGTSKVPTISLADAHIPPPTSDRISHEGEHVMRDGKQEEECLNGAPLIFQGVPNIDSSSADVFFRRESCPEDNAVRSTDAVNGSLIHPRIQEDSNIGLQATADVKACFPEDPKAFWMENDYDFNWRSLKKECTQPIEPDSTLKFSTKIHDEHHSDPSVREIKLHTASPCVHPGSFIAVP